MIMELNKYMIQCTSSIIDVIKKIDNNKKGFVFVVDQDQAINGILTDGDIRRALMNDYKLSSKVSLIVNPNYQYLNENDNFETVVNKFKDEKIEFLPILNSNRKICNILTKQQFHQLLLQGESLNLQNDFSRYDSYPTVFEIYNRPWGFYKTVFLSDFVQAKVIYIFQKQKLSLQYHKKREEHWVVIKGRGIVTIGESVKEVSEGSYIFIPKICKHRIENNSEKETLIISEVQLGTYFGEDDIIRIEDKYGRK